MALHSALAPTSKKTTTPFSVGMQVAIAGRATPSNRPKVKREVAITAPVLPLEIKASTLFSFCSLEPTAMEEFFFSLRASVGLSSIRTFSVAFSMVKKELRLI